MVVLLEAEVDLVTPTGLMRTLLFQPNAPGRYPGVVFYSEIFQITGPIRRAAAFLAGHGYVVAVPEVYHDLLPRGAALAYDKAGAELGNAHKTGRPTRAYDDDTRACIAHLRALPTCTGRIGTMGPCLGGHLAFRAALQPEVVAAACFYPTDLHRRGLGQKDEDTLDRLKEIRAELLLVFGRQDPHIAPEGRRLVHDALVAAGLAFSWHEVNGQHAFLRDEGSSGRYDPALARLCWELALDLFQRRLWQER